jgi:hypothetical protein
VQPGSRLAALGHDLGELVLRHREAHVHGTELVDHRERRLVLFDDVAGMNEDLTDPAIDR